MNPHDIFVFEYRGGLATYYRLLCGRICTTRAKGLLEVCEDVKSVNQFSDLTCIGIPLKSWKGVFKDFKYLGRLSEELIEDILFMEELCK